jgi:threonine/homoserine/homoserine lactone efflux protein
MRTLRIASIAFVTGFSGAIMPGPMLALTIGQVSARGFWAAPAIVLGHAILELAVVIALIAGLRAVLQRHSVRGAIGILGGLALVYMGYDMFGAASAQELEMTAEAAALPWGRLIIAGAAVCVVNPYFTAWWATVGAGQMAHFSPKNVKEYLAFYLGHEMSDLVWYAFVGIVVAFGGQHLNLKWLTMVCALIIAALGLWFMYSGIRFALGHYDEDMAVEPGETAAEEIIDTTDETGHDAVSVERERSK